MTHSDRDPLDVLAEFVAEAPFSQPGWREKARILLADALVLSRAASGVAGYSTVMELGAGTGTHRSWASDARLGPADAVQANAVAVCARFQEDTEMSSWGHPGGFVVPAAVGAAIHAGRDVRSLIDGLVAGYAATSWLGGNGEVAEGVMRRGLRPSPTFAPAGACAAACRSLGLSAEQTRNALGGAALTGRGTLHSVGAGGDDWRLHNATAARDGFLYSLAASEGMISGPRALTSPVGFLFAYAGTREPPRTWSVPPTGDLILGVWHKAFATLGDNMAVALAARDVHTRLEGAIPDRVVVHMNERFAGFPGTQTQPPFRSATAALASVRFVTARLLLAGRLDLPDYELRDDPDIVDLCERMEVVADPKVDFTDATVNVEAGGSSYTCRTRDLPSTLFFRDPEEQRSVAAELLGEAGPRLVDAVLETPESDEVAGLIERALDAVPAQRTR